MSTSTQWRGSFTKANLCKGNSKGIVLEGIVIDTRVHSVFVTAGSSNPSDQGKLLKFLLISTFYLNTICS